MRVNCSDSHLVYLAKMLRVRAVRDDVPLTASAVRAVDRRELSGYDIFIYM